MTVEQCYNSFGGDYATMIGRISKPELIKRLMKKFPADTSMSTLCDAMERMDCDAAFRAAHTLKGVSMNLSFARLAAVSSEMTELLRAGRINDCGEVYPKVQAAYKDVVDAIAQLDA